MLIISSTQGQSPTEYHRYVVPHPGEQPPLEEEGSTTLVASGGLNKDEIRSNQVKVNETKYVLNSPSQTRMILQGSAVIFSEEPPHHRSSGDLVIPPPPSQPLYLTFDRSQVCGHSITEIPEGHKAREGATPSPGPSSNSTQPRSPSVQSGDCLPTFTSQRPSELPTAMGKQAQSNTWNVTTPYECRYVYIHNSSLLPCAGSRGST